MRWGLRSNLKALEMLDCGPITTLASTLRTRIPRPLRTIPYASHHPFIHPFSALNPSLNLNLDSGPSLTSPASHATTHKQEIVRDYHFRDLKISCLNPRSTMAKYNNCTERLLHSAIQYASLFQRQLRHEPTLHIISYHIMSYHITASASA